MPVQDADTLKSYFVKRRVPTRSNYIDLIDSMFGLFGPPTEGPGIDVIGVTVGVGGDSILIYDDGGVEVAEYSATNEGLINALDAMTPGQMLILPLIKISGGPWTIKNGVVKGLSMHGSILDGEVIVSEGCKLEDVSIVRSVSDAGTIYGAILENNSFIEHCYIYLINSIGSVIGVFSMENMEGYGWSMFTQVYAYGTINGYAYGTDGVGISIIGGSAFGSTAPVRI